MMGLPTCNREKNRFFKSTYIIYRDESRILGFVDLISGFGWVLLVWNKKRLVIVSPDYTLMGRQLTKKQAQNLIYAFLG